MILLDFTMSVTIIILALTYALNILLEIPHFSHAQLIVLSIIPLFPSKLVIFTFQLLLSFHVINCLNCKLYFTVILV
jgi:hypothetical protein